MESREARRKELVESPETLRLLQENATAWCNTQGLIMYTPQGDGRPAPVTMLPFPFPRNLFEEANAIAPLFNTLYMNVSNDYEWLSAALAGAGKDDEFTGRLLRIMHTIHAEGLKKDIKLMINRSDYMLNAHDDQMQLRQVEINTIAASFACLSQKTFELHRYLNDYIGEHSVEVSSLPVNTTLIDVPNGLATAFETVGNPNAVVVFLVQPGERNSIDQQWLQLTLWQRHNIRTVRLTLNDVALKCTLHHDRSLTYEGQAIAIVYMRAGYTPNDYPSETEWDARLTLERSTAVLCPDIGQHLAGAKKVQQELTRPNALERFCDANTAKRLRAVFAQFRSFDVSEAAETCQIALANPGKYVLKPQREGGGNNLYDDDMVKEIQSHVAVNKTLEAYILMERLRPPTAPTIILRDHSLIMGNEALPELGVYGLLVRNGSLDVMNRAGGFLTRTKLTGVNDGGVAAGNAVLDSVMLV